MACMSDAYFWGRMIDVNGRISVGLDLEEVRRRSTAWL